MYVGNNGVGVGGAMPELGNALMNVGNDHIRVYYKFGLKAGVSNCRS